MKHYFIFKGINSLDMNIIVTAVPDVIKPPKRANSITIPGRHGVLHETEETYSNYTKDVECAIKNRSRTIEYEKIDEWLDGYGELIFSSEPGFVYRAMVNNQISIAGVAKRFSKFLVQFDVYPLKYNVQPESDQLTLTAPATIYSKGTYYSEPIITVYGSGTVTLNINGIAYTLSDISGYVTINSEIQEVYKDNVNKNNTFTPSAVTGKEFPRLEVGENKLSFTGNVTKIEIQPNYRWL